MKRFAEAAIIMLIALAFCGCSQLFRHDDTPERYAAYYEKCQEYVTIYGSPSVTWSDDKRWAQGSGLCLVRLLDMDGDNREELILAYITTIEVGNYSSGLEVWSFDRGDLTCDYKGPISMRGTNGFLPFLKVVPVDSGGCAIMGQRCYGSAPEAFAFDAYGYRDGVFCSLMGRAYKSEFYSPISRYVCPSGTGDYWMDGEWISATELEYEEAFASFSSEPVIEADLFYEGYQDYGDQGKSLLDEIEASRETISLLADGAKKLRR